MVERGNSSDVEFIVKADKGVVVCKLYNCSEIPVRRISKQVGTIFPYSVENYEIDNVYIGVAKCSPEDTFDEETGKRIALTKAKRKRGQAINNALKEFIADAEKDLKRIVEYGIHKIPDVE